VFSPSIVYTPGERWLTVLDRFSYLPAMPISGSGDALYQPIWADDVADCVISALDNPGEADRRAFELAGPETLSYEDIVRTALEPTGRRRALVHLPRPVVHGSLRVLERLTGPAAFATREEAALLEEPMTSARGTADAESLGVMPLRMSAVLGA